MRRFGLHTSISGGLHRALLRGEELGCDAIQFFSHNPRGWRTTPISEEDAKLFKETRKRTGITPVAAHASYLLNIASPDDALRARSVDMLRQEMLRADVLGADFVILHTGTAHDGQGLKRAALSIKDALAEIDTDAGLLLENTSGKRGDTTYMVTALAELFSLTSGLCSGVCIDSCHAFAAGYDLTSDEGAQRLSDEVMGHIGADLVKLLHLNDSKGEMASGTDRHEHIGKGNIGAKGLARFLCADPFVGKPAILETPRTCDEDDISNLAEARALQAG
ncbi:MAG: deoxyribonuclease IV [Thermodesulfovibrionales bacterium]|nr:deoxyribonuclease IV [Thermodesulfovibrionales bacterium]